MIVGVGHVALQVSDLDRSVLHATQVMGLRVVEQRGATVFLSHGPRQPSLEYREGPVTALDHVAFQVSSDIALDDVAARLRESGLEIGDGPVEPHTERGIRFRAGSGHIFDVFVPSADTLADYSYQGQPAVVSSGVRPRRVGHVNLNFRDLEAARALFVNALGFRESDIIVAENGDERLVFLRCNVAHHDVGVARGPDGLFHYAYEVDTTQDLVRLGDALDATGQRLLWGPGRHGAGDNIATYHAEPSGILIEYYAEMQVINDERWVARRWSVADYRLSSVWGSSADVAPLYECSIPLC